MQQGTGCGSKQYQELLAGGLAAHIPVIRIAHICYAGPSTHQPVPGVQELCCGCGHHQVKLQAAGGSCRQTVTLAPAACDVDALLCMASSKNSTVTKYKGDVIKSQRKRGRAQVGTLGARSVVTALVATRMWGVPMGISISIILCLCTGRTSFQASQT